MEMLGLDLYIQYLVAEVPVSEGSAVSDRDTGFLTEAQRRLKLSNSSSQPGCKVLCCSAASKDHGLIEPDLPSSLQWCVVNNTFGVT